MTSGYFLLLPYARSSTPTTAISVVRRRVSANVAASAAKHSISSEETKLHDATFLPRKLYEAVQENPSLIKYKAVADAFLPTPWLLPCAAQVNEVLGYQGLYNNLDGLLHVRSLDISSLEFLGVNLPAAAPERTSKGAISVVYFGKSHTLLMQNWVYTAVRWAGITNYIVATWEEGSLQACLAMNLPCFNASAYLPIPIEEGLDAEFRSTAYRSITWVKPLLTRHILERGYHVHSSDVDIAFPPKAFWPSMLHYLVPAGADVAMQRYVWGPLNTGCVVLRPTQYAKALMSTWMNVSREEVAQIVDQERLAQLSERVYQMCEGPWDCRLLTAKREGERQDAERRGSGGGDGAHTSEEGGGATPPQWAVVRRYHSAWDAMYQDQCAGAAPEWLSPIDPCQPGSINYHVICTSGASNKTKGIKLAGLWFLDEGPSSNCTSPPLEGLPAVSAQQAAAAAQRFLKRAGKRGEGGTTHRSHTGATTAGQGQQEGAVWRGEGQRRWELAEELGRGQGQGGLMQQPGVGAEGAAAGRVHPPDGVPRCRPLHWRVAAVDAGFARCDRRQLAWVSYPPGAIHRSLQRRSFS